MSHKIYPLRKFPQDLLYSLKSPWIILLILLITYFYFPFYSDPIIKFQADNNKQELKEIVNNLIAENTTDSEKTVQILNWFDRSANNMINIYGTTALHRGNLKIYFEPPYICIRLNGNKNPLWVLTSRCGACSEYSLLFREMATAANLTVRSVHNLGEDHNWAEVLINDMWITVNPSAVHLLKNKTGFNVSISRPKNVSYVFTEDSFGNREDISKRYTNLSNISFIVTDTEEKLLEDIKISVLSNNLQPEVSTGVACITAVKGTCNITIGGGNYTILATDKKMRILYNKTSITIKEHKKYDKTVHIKKNKALSCWRFINKIYLFVEPFILYAVILFVYYELKQAFARKE